jgi:colanic acid/amylovoran biosynthesis glycosyltransferase
MPLFNIPYRKTIGILIPEFPGQTHNFFWREISALNELSFEVQTFSTRRPRHALMSPSWAAEAARKTIYLFPLSILSSVRALSALLRGILRWRSVFIAFELGRVRSFRDLFEFFGIVLVGAHFGDQCRRRAIDHVHVHSCAKSAEIALAAHLLTGLTYSLTLHNPIGLWGGKQCSKWGHAEFGIVITNWMLEDLIGKYGTCLPKHIFVAPMGVDVDAFRRSSEYLPFESDSGLPLRIFSCGRLNPGKGFEYLIRAVAALKDEGMAVELVIAGEDDLGGTGYRAVVESLIGNLDLQGTVRLLGAVCEERIKEELEAAHVFALASPEEPLGVVFMEAMAMCVPTIGTAAGGVPELISHGVNGVLVPPRNSAKLAEAIRMITSDIDLARRLSSAGRTTVEQYFHHRISAARIAEGLSTREEPA